MNKYDYSNLEKELNKDTINASKKSNIKLLSNKDDMLTIMPEWSNLCIEADNYATGKISSVESIFTDDELTSAEDYITRLKNEFDEVYKLDKTDYIISVLAGILSGVIDVCFVKFPEKTKDGMKYGKLEEFIRSEMDRVLPKDVIKDLENKAKVPYDAQDNRNTKVFVDGLSSWLHRDISLGHDPSLIGFIVGVHDIMNGTMTTIDRKGKIVSQVMEYAQDRKAQNIFEAIGRQFLHYLSDINTPQGLPAPLMTLCNLLQIDVLTDEHETIAEVVESLYVEGYDFQHFLALSIPAMVTEVIVRVSYFIKRKKLGSLSKDTFSLSTNESKNPKLGTMLFIASSTSVLINSGKMIIIGKKKGTMAGLLSINYVQWLAFSKYAFKELKWALVNKKELRDKYINNRLNEELNDILNTKNKELIVIESNKEMNKQKYIASKRKMKFKDEKSLEDALNVIMESTFAIKEKDRTIKDSMIPEILSCVLIADVASHYSFSQLYEIGSIGLSKANETNTPIKHFDSKDAAILTAFQLTGGLPALAAGIGIKAGVESLVNYSNLKKDKNQIYRYAIIRRKDLFKCLEDFKKDSVETDRRQYILTLYLLLDTMVNDLEFDLGIRKICN